MRSQIKKHNDDDQCQRDIKIKHELSENKSHHKKKIRKWRTPIQKVTEKNLYAKYGKSPSLAVSLPGAVSERDTCE